MDRQKPIVGTNIIIIDSYRLFCINWGLFPNNQKERGLIGASDAYIVHILFINDIPPVYYTYCLEIIYYVHSKCNNNKLTMIEIDLFDLFTYF